MKRFLSLILVFSMLILVPVTVHGEEVYTDFDEFGTSEYDTVYILLHFKARNGQDSFEYLTEEDFPYLDIERIDFFLGPEWVAIRLKEKDGRDIYDEIKKIFENPPEIEDGYIKSIGPEVLDEEGCLSDKFESATQLYDRFFRVTTGLEEGSEPHHMYLCDSTLPKSFSDVKKGRFYSDAASVLGGAGVMNGVGGDRFSPDTPLTRAMLAQVLYNLYKLTKDEDYRFDVSNPLVRFKDVKESDWFYEAVMWAANGEGNTMVGTGGDKFEPNIPVTRAMVATALYRFMTALELESADADQNVLLAFADGDTVPLYSKDAVSAFALSGILKGRPGRIIDAKTNMTRGEVATLIVRAFPKVMYLSLER